MPAAPLNADAGIRLIAESPGIRLGAALDACRDSGFVLPEVSATFCPPDQCRPGPTHR